MLYPELFKTMEAVRWNMATSIPWSEFDGAKLQGTPSFLINGKFVGGFAQDELESLIEATRQQIRS